MSSYVSRFWDKVDKRSPDDCWPWLGYVSRRGYGRYADGHGGSATAHRVSYELAHGPVPDGMTVDHRCHTAACTLGDACPHRRCVNPAHLQALTNAENVALGTSFSAVNARKTHCINGHELSPENIYERPGRRVCKLCARDRASRHRQGGYVRPSRRH